jgi:uncharacterized protein
VWGCTAGCNEVRAKMTTTVTSRATALLEVVAVIAIGYLTRAALHLFVGGLASGAVATVVVLAVATWLLRRRGTGWSDLGCRRPPSMRTAAIWTAGLLLVYMLLVPALTSMFANALRLPAQRLEVFDQLRGNLVLYLMLLIPITWGTAAFGEELIFRGFLARRLADALGGTGRAELVALVGQATLFGFVHAYLGPRGMLNAGALGLLAGLCFRWNGRNLWPLFIAHGLVDSIGLTVLFLGLAHA